MSPTYKLFSDHITYDVRLSTISFITSVGVCEGQKGLLRMVGEGIKVKWEGVEAEKISVQIEI